MMLKVDGGWEIRWIRRRNIPKLPNQLLGCRMNGGILVSCFFLSENGVWSDGGLEGN